VQIVFNSNTTWYIDIYFGCEIGDYIISKELKWLED